MISRNRNSLTFIIMALILGSGIYLYINRSEGLSPIIPTPTDPASNSDSTPTDFDPRNATYDLEGMSVTLVDGWGESEADPGVVTTILTRYVGYRATGDLDGDGREDTVFLLSQDSGGSGVIYYAIAVLNTTEGHRITNAVFIGDRIVPRETAIADGQAIVYYKDRSEGEPMTAEPTLTVTKELRIDSQGKLTE